MPMSATPVALLLLSPAALATAEFDPTTPAAVFEGVETYDQAGELKLWSRVERLEDPDRSLFTQESFNEAVAWPEEADWAPWIDDCFGSTTPHSSVGLLHMGLNESVASGTPILMVPGAGDNGVRAYVTLGTKIDRLLRPVYVLTFAHPHGDVFQQAEMVADAITRIKERTGAEQVDVVSHSKGGIATAVYLSNDGSGTWGDAGYDGVGTTYRGDVRKAVFVATPLGGIDTAFRWPAANLASLVKEDALAPTSWVTYYPYSSYNPVVTTDLADQYIGGTGADYFPGHRQLLARWDDSYDLPGAQPWLGAYAWQTDWWTTYYGGKGYWSYSEGIDDAIAAGGGLLDQVAARGVDPDVQLYLLAGKNPLMPNGTEDWLVSTFDESWVDVISGGLDDWGALVADIAGNTFSTLGVTEAEVAGLASGDLVMGEVSGESDGLVFVESATLESALDARGARVVDSYVADLSHIDLLYASPVTGELLIESAEEEDGEPWMVAVGERYSEADSLGWIVEALADEEDGDGGAEDGGAEDGGAEDGGVEDGGVEDGGAADGGAADGGAADGGSQDDSEDTGADSSPNGGCGRCSGVPAGAALGWSVLLGLLGVIRRRR